MISKPTRAAYFVNRILGTRLNTSAGTNPKINELMTRYPDKLPSFKKAGHRVIPQNDIFCDPEFMHRIEERVACRLPHKEDKWVLWLGQPVEEVGLGDHQEEAMIAVFRTFIKENYRILVKPHPRGIKRMKKKGRAAK